MSRWTRRAWAIYRELRDELEDSEPIAMVKEIYELLLYLRRIAGERRAGGQTGRENDGNLGFAGYEPGER